MPGRHLIAGPWIWSADQLLRTIVSTQRINAPLRSQAKPGQHVHHFERSLPQSITATIQIPDTRWIMTDRWRRVGACGFFFAVWPSCVSHDLCPQFHMWATDITNMSTHEAGEASSGGFRRGVGWRIGNSEGGGQAECEIFGGQPEGHEIFEGGCMYAGAAIHLPAPGE